MEDKDVAIGTLLFSPLIGGVGILLAFWQMWWIRGIWEFGLTEILGEPWTLTQLVIVRWFVGGFVPTGQADLSGAVFYPMIAYLLTTFIV